MDFEKLVGSKVEFHSVIKDITVHQAKNMEMIMLGDVYINGVYFKDHSWIKMTKRLSEASIGDTINATAILTRYINPETLKYDKLGFEHIRSVVMFNCSKCKWFSNDGTCDMCAYGYPHTIDNNGLKPHEVKACDAYRKKDQ